MENIRFNLIIVFLSFLSFLNAGGQQLPREGIIDGHSYVNLGLPSGTIWATLNIGASAQNDLGNLFAWGSTRPLTDLTPISDPLDELTISLSDNKTYENSTPTWRKPIFDITGLPEYDAATSLWGKNWCMPQKYQVDELMENCTWDWITIQGTPGYKVTGPNGKSIFLPAAGYSVGQMAIGQRMIGLYWISDSNDDGLAYCYLFSHLGKAVDRYERRCGLSIRPVLTAKCPDNGLLPDGNPAQDPENNHARNGVNNPHNGNKPTENPSRLISHRGDKIVPFDSIIPDSLPEHKHRHKYVDLGLPSGTKWAVENIGANHPSNFGNYYAWGENHPKSSYPPNSCSTFDKEMDEISGKVPYDVARYAWGSPWSVPTLDQFKELVSYCTWEKWQLNGITGYKATGPNGNSIFLPATGGFFDKEKITDDSAIYWTGTPLEDNPKGAYFFYMLDQYNEINWAPRGIGLSVRAVHP